MNLRDIPGHPREQASKPLGGAHAKEPLTAPGRSATSCEEQGTLKIGESYLRGLNIPQGAFTLMSLILMLKPIRRVGPLAFGLPTRFRIPPTLNTIRIGPSSSFTFLSLIWNRPFLQKAMIPYFYRVVFRNLGIKTWVLIQLSPWTTTSLITWNICCVLPFFILHSSVPSYYLIFMTCEVSGYKLLF